MRNTQFLKKLLVNFSQVPWKKCLYKCSYNNMTTKWKTKTWWVPAIKSFGVSNNPLLDMLKLCTKLYILNQRPIFKTVHHHASVKDNSMKYYNFFFLEGEGFGRTTRYGKKTFSDELAVTQDVKATPPHL